MKKESKIIVKRILGMVLSIALLTGIPGVTQVKAYAAECDTVESLEAVVLKATEANVVKQTRTMMTNCIISVSCSEEGLHMDIITGTVGVASVLGIKDVVVKKKVWYGWKTVAISSGAEDYNQTSFGISLTYSDAEYGETYRITCVHYADVDGYIEGENDTGALVFTY